MFPENWRFAELHMPAIQQKLMMLPSGVFLDFTKADIKRDYEEATDLILEIAGGTMAVRIRRNKYLEIGMRNGFDWSIRYRCRTHKTEIHKLREGFGDWYFYGYSADDKGKLGAWWLLDLECIREQGILSDSSIDAEWPIYDNKDGTAGLYIPMSALQKNHCVIHCEFGQTPSKRKVKTDDNQISLF